MTVLPGHDEIVVTGKGIDFAKTLKYFFLNNAWVCLGHLGFREESFDKEGLPPLSLDHVQAPGKAGHQDPIPGDVHSGDFSGKGGQAMDKSDIYHGEYLPCG